ncbi:hypothetical protein BKP42_63990 [Rhodococcus erythropolis]|nr:hypothetical protein BKP42_63990 [Rhodococcus erythropolis]
MKGSACVRDEIRGTENPAASQNLARRRIGQDVVCCARHGQSRNRRSGTGIDDASHRAGSEEITRCSEYLACRNDRVPRERSSLEALRVRICNQQACPSLGCETYNIPADGAQSLHQYRSAVECSESTTTRRGLHRFEHAQSRCVRAGTGATVVDRTPEDVLGGSTELIHVRGVGVDVRTGPVVSLELVDVLRVNVEDTSPSRRVDPIARCGQCYHRLPATHRQVGDRHFQCHCAGELPGVRQSVTDRGIMRGPRATRRRSQTGGVDSDHKGRVGLPIMSGDGQFTVPAQFVVDAHCRSSPGYGSTVRV